MFGGIMTDSLLNSPLQKLNPSTTALLVIDLQKSIAKNPNLVPYSGECVLNNASILANAFKENGAFVVFVKLSIKDLVEKLSPDADRKESPPQFEEGWDELMPELSVSRTDCVISKKQWGAFYGTDLDSHLRRRGITTIVLCGITTGYGVDTTAREAYQHNYNQIFAVDAMSSWSKEQHEYVCTNIFPLIGKMRTTEVILNALY
jgi:nicotinamidase-related amidase